MLYKFIRLAFAALLLAITAPPAADAACTTGRCRNAVYAPGAKSTKFGAISSGHQTSYGVTSGHQTSYGVTSGHQTSYGVTSGHQTSYGVTGAGCHPTAYGIVCSDVRLKRDIVAIGRLDNGLALYRYRYIWSKQLYVGVMAQEVSAIVPEAVMRGADGYLSVDYSRLGLHLQTWDDWKASHRTGADRASTL
jgi:hypothetical protein